MQVEALDLSGLGTLERRATEFAPQARDDALQALLLGRALRCLFGQRAEFQRQCIFTATLEHTDHAQPCARISALAVNTQGQRKVADALGVLADLEQRFGLSAAQPRVVELHAVDLFDDLFQRFTGLEAQLALMQEQAGVDVFTTAQASGVSAELDFFISEDAQVGQHELRPVLIKVAEEHQAQAIAQVHQGQAEQPVSQLRRPGAQGLRVGELFGQHRQPFVLAPFRLIDKGAERLQELGLEQDIEQFCQCQIRVFIEPAVFEQRPRRLGNVADFQIIEFARAKVNALAHDHAYQQSLRGLRQRVEVANEAVFACAHHIGITKSKPIKHLPEVVEVIERIVERVGGHGNSKPRQANTGYAYRYQLSPARRKRKKINGIFSRRYRTFPPMLAPTALQGRQCPQSHSSKESEVGMKIKMLGIPVAVAALLALGGCSTQTVVTLQNGTQYLTEDMPKTETEDGFYEFEDISGAKVKVRADEVATVRKED